MEGTDDDVLCPFHWAQPIHALNCEIVWPKELDEPPYDHLSDTDDRALLSPHSCGSPYEELDMLSEERYDASARGHYLELDTPEYSGVISERWIVERLLAMAGVRLAGVLNWLFADFEEGIRAEGNKGLWVMDDF